jgi:hypothetical protein
MVYPFRHADDERIDLGALMFQQYPDPTGRLRDWTWAFVRGLQTGRFRHANASARSDVGAGESRSRNASVSLCRTVL